MNRLTRFLKNVVITAKDKIVDFFVGVYHHAEAITVSVLSAIGLSALLGELPFIYLLPLWVEGPFVIPVFSVFIIWLLLKSAEWRAERRNPLHYLMT